MHCNNVHCIQLSIIGSVYMYCIIHIRYGIIIATIIHIFKLTYYIMITLRAIQLAAHGYKLSAHAFCTTA